MNIVNLNSFTIYRRNKKVISIEGTGKNAIYKFNYQNENPIININSNNIKEYQLIYSVDKNKERYFILTKKDDKSFFLKINMNSILYFILINNKKNVKIILKKCAKIIFNQT